MLPVLINEHLIQPFNFFFNQQIHQGMRHGQELYKLVCEFSPYDRLRAYQQACDLLDQGGEIVITASTGRYGVWMNLRSPTAAETLEASAQSTAEVCAV